MIFPLLAIAQASTVNIVVDASRSEPISPYIYGVNYPDSAILDWAKSWQEFRKGFTLVREGGNRFTAYNWETNASNAGSDYFNENDDYLGVSNEPGWTVQTFLNAVQSNGAAAILTVPTLGYVSKDKTTERDGGRDVKNTPNYLKVRFLPSYAHKPGGHFDLRPDGSDGAVYQDEFVNWVEKTRLKNAPVWFSLDNEPDLWAQTHSRICPVAPTYESLCKNNIDYAMAIKAVAPKSLVFGPANYGWNGFRTLQDARDGAGRVFVDVYLDSMRQAALTAGKRLLDVYDFHYYPEATGDGIRITFTNQPDKPGTSAARIQAPRSLWDDTFIEKSWITQNGKPMRLLPDMRERVAAHYPGTKLSISEYDFGGRNSISGALAQADALGIFGRYGLFAACHWGLSPNDKAALAGFKAFSDYDRRGSRFGDRELVVSGETAALNSVYAARNSTNLHLVNFVVINKSSEPCRFHLALKGFHPKTYKTYAVGDGAYDHPTEARGAASADGILIDTSPLSITTVEAADRN